MTTTPEDSGQQDAAAGAAPSTPPRLDEMFTSLLADDALLAFDGDSGMLVAANAAARGILGLDRKSTRLNSSHSGEPRMPSSA